MRKALTFIGKCFFASPNQSTMFLKIRLASIFSFVFLLNTHGQDLYSVNNVHAHNDYEYNIPFVQAFGLGIGSIEADVILRNDTLYVSHDERDIEKRRLYFETHYIQPLANAQETGKGRPLILLIDLKTEATSTLAKVVSIIEKYPSLTYNQDIQFVITGNQPPAEIFHQYPQWVRFDGRLNNPSHFQHLDRIGMFSANFRDYTKWNGKGLIPATERQKIQEAVNRVHAAGKKIRFWASPDVINSWYVFMDMKIDFINTDHVEELAVFMNRLPQTTSLPANQYVPYEPLYKVDRTKKKVKNIILLIGDGTGLAQWYAGYTGNQGRLNVFKMKSIGLSITKSADSYITESAAGASAIATGKKTNNNFVSVSPDSVPVASIPELLVKKNIRSAIISTGDITDATPAAFYAHVPNRNWSEEIAAGFLQSEVDILMGAGWQHFAERKEGSLMPALQQKGYTVLNNIAGIDAVKSNRVVVLDEDAGKPSYKGRGDFLQKALAFSTRTLQQHKPGFFIMAEGAQVDWAAHDNQLEWMVQEVQDLDKAIGDMMRFVDENKETLLIVTADHETGGLTLLNGNLQTGKVQGQYASNDHTAISVPVFAYGPQSDLFSGVYQNTEIFEKIIQLIGR